jgi:hypothetical protein
MPSIGQILREAREKKGVSIPDVSHSTRIKIDYLERMESDQFDRLIAPAYARSFLKMYSEYLGLNSAEMLELLNKWQPTKFAAPAPAAASAPRKPAMPSGKRPTQPPAPPPKSDISEDKPASPYSQTPQNIAPPNVSTQQRQTKFASAPTATAPGQKPQQGGGLKLVEEEKKAPPPPPPPALEQQRGFPLKATLAVVVVITVILTAIVLLNKRRGEKNADYDASELKAQETVRSQPRRAADVLPLPPAP